MREGEQLSQIGPENSNSHLFLFFKDSSSVHEMSTQLARLTYPIMMLTFKV